MSRNHHQTSIIASNVNAFSRGVIIRALRKLPLRRHQETIGCYRVTCLPVLMALIATTLTAPAVAQQLIESTPNSVIFSPAPGTTGGEDDATQTERQINPGVSRQRVVTINTGVIRDAGADAGTFTVPMFSDASFDAVVEKAVTTDAGNLSLRGSLVDQEAGWFNLILTPDDVLSGTFSDGKTVYRVRYTADDVHIVESLAPADAAPSLEPLIPPAGATDPVASQRSPHPRALPVQDDGSVVDVLVVYTPAVAAALGGRESAVLAMIDLAVDETNQGYANSGVDHRVRLVHSEQVAYSEALNELPLLELSAVNDGVLDEVPVLRDRFGADVVVMIAEIFSVCGQAFLTGSADGSSEFAYAIAARNCATGFFAFGHEIGHNFGASHDRAEPDEGLFDYSHGYIGNGWRTIMAYANCGNDFCPVVNYYSNPANTYNGNPMGISPPSPDAADNVSTLNATAFAVANYRQSVAEVVLPELRSPTTSQPLSGSEQIFEWSEGNVNADAFQLYVGSAAGSSDYFASDEISGATQTLAFDLPTDGSQLYVTLRYRVDGEWQSLSYTFTAFEQVDVDIASPPNGSTLTGPAVTFTLSNEVPSGYVWQVRAGNTVDGLELFESEWLSNAEVSVLVDGLPEDGRLIYVTLRYRAPPSPNANNEVLVKRYQYTANQATDTEPDTINPDADAVTFDVELDPGTFAHPGDEITVRFTVTNSSDVLARNVRIDSEALYEGRCDVGNVWASVTVDCVGMYSVTSADIAAGEVAFNGELSFDGLVSPRGIDAVAVYEPGDKDDEPDEPNVTLSSRANAASFSTVGERIDFDIEVSNEGGEVITDIVITNPDTQKTVCEIGTLWPTYSAVCTEVRFVSQADIERGELRNVSEVVYREQRGGVASVQTSVSAEQSTAASVVPD